MIIYFSNISNNTHRFVNKLGLPADRIPIDVTEASQMVADKPYVLITPTYGETMNHVPQQVKKFLKNGKNSSLMLGVIGAGNTNFGDKYCAAAKIISAKFQVPLLYTFELLGMPEDVKKVQDGLKEFYVIHL